MGWCWSWEMLELAKHSQAVGSMTPVLGSTFQVSVGASWNRRGVRVDGSCVTNDLGVDGLCVTSAG